MLDPEFDHPVNKTSCVKKILPEMQEKDGIRRAKRMAKLRSLCLYALIADCRNERQRGAVK